MKDDATGASLIASNHNNHGYATLTVDAKTISGTITLVDEKKYPGNPAFDTFSYPAEAIKLGKGVVMNL